MGSLLQDVIGLFSKKKYAPKPYDVNTDGREDYLVLSTKQDSSLNVMAYLPKLEQELISIYDLADAINGAGNTTYDFANVDVAGKTNLNLTGSDGTVDTVSLVGSTGITIASNGSDVELSVTAGTYVECTGSNTANVIPMWDGGTCSLKDSDFTFDGNNMYTLDASKKLSLGWLRMNNAAAVIEVSNGTGAVGQVLTVAAGGVLEWSTNGTGSMSSWKIAGDVGASQIISDGDEVTFGGGQKIVTEVQGTQTLKITHDNTARTDTTSTVTPGPGVQFSVIDVVQTDSMGHITDVNTKQVTMPTISGVTSVSTLTAGTISIGGTAQDPTVSTITTGVSDGGTGLATGDQIYDFVIGLGYGIVDSVTAGNGIEVTGTAQDPVVSIDYSGVDNAILVAPTEVATAQDFLWFSDATNDNIRKVKIGDLPISGGGAVTQIVAGTNVTVSPGSGVGVVTVNSTDQFQGTVTSVGTSNGTFIDVSGGTITSAGTITADLSAGGTPSSSTFLRGDNTWATVPSDTNTTYDLSSIQAGSDVNVNLVAANPASTDTVKLVAGSNVTLTDNGSSEITIAATGSVTSVNATTAGDALDVSGGPITSSGSLAFTWAGSTSEYVNGEGDLVTFPSFQAPLTLTTTGTSGAATLVGNTLNIPQYAGGSSTDEKFKIDGADTAAGYFTDKVTIGSGLSGSVNTDPSGVKTLTISAVSFPYVSSIKVGSSTDSGSFEFVGPGVTMTSGTPPTEIEFASVVTLAATTAGDALDVAVTNNSTTTGISTAAFTWAGSGSQYVDGQGNLQTFPSIPSAYTFNVEGDTGSAYAVPSGGTVDVAGGTGISTANASGVITVDLDNSGVTAGSYTNANITVNAQGQITLASNGSAGMTSWTAQGDSGTDQVITDGDKLLFTGDGTIVTQAQATDEILIKHVASGVTAGSYTLADVTVDAKGHITSIANGTAVAGVNLLLGTSSGAPLSANVSGTTLNLTSNVFAGSGNIGHVPSSSGVDQQKFFLRADGTWAAPGSAGGITAGCGIDVNGTQVSVEYGPLATNVVNCAAAGSKENFDIDVDTILYDDKNSGGAGIHEAKEIVVADVFDRAVQRSTFPLPVAWGKVVTGTSGFASPANAGRSAIGPMSYSAISSSSGTLSWSSPLSGVNYVIQLTCDSVTQAVHCYARNKQTTSVIIGTKTMAGADLPAQELDYVIYDTSLSAI